LDAEPNEDERQAVGLLVDKGVWSNVARDLVRRHGPEACRLRVESLRFQKGVTDPPAWLRWAIETSHPLPNHLRPQPLLMEEGEPRSTEGMVGNDCESNVPPTSSRIHSAAPSRPPSSAERRKEGYEWLFGE
jgi:hypothetical protein